ASADRSPRGCGQARSAVYGQDVVAHAEQPLAPHLELGRQPDSVRLGLWRTGESLPFMPMSLNRIIGRWIELADPDMELPLWRYVYGSKPKPYFHPVCTPAGHCLTLFEPHDHLWHRGLWYTIKFINGENFWEEREPFGTERTALPPSIEHVADGRIVLRSELDWVRPDGGSAV